MVFIDTTVRAGLTNLSLTFLRAMVTKLGIKPRKEEVESLWRKGIEDVGVRRELEMCVEPRRYVRPHRRPDVGGANYEASSKYVPRGVRLPSPEQRQAIAAREETRATRRLPSP